MKCKSLAAVAVLAMFLASSFCVLAVAEDNNGVELRNANTTPLIIDSTGVISGTLNDYNATYDKDSHTLTLNGGVSVNCTCTAEQPFIIDARIDDLTIIVKGVTELKSNDHLNDDVGGIRVLRTHTTLYDDDGILNIKGDGTLKLVLPTTNNQGRTSVGIFAYYVNIIKCKFIIDASNVDAGNFRGIDAASDSKSNSYLNIIDATVTIIGTGRDMAANVGLYCNKAMTIQNSIVVIEKITEGIFGETSRLSKVAEGTCTIINSEVTISGFDSEGKSSSIGMDTVNVNSSILTATTGDVTGESYNAVNINANILNVENSTVTLTTKKGNHTSCIEFGTVTTIKHSRLNCNSSVGNGMEVIGDYDACIKTTSKSIFNAYESEIIAKNNRTTAGDNIFGIFTNCVFVNSTFNVSAGEHKAFAKTALDGSSNPFDFTVAIDTSTITALKGSNDGQNWTDITDTTQIFNYNGVKGNKINTAIFDLNGGEGSAVPMITDLKTGDKITLPQCDAKKDGKVFLGWNDGKNIYKPGTEYTVEGDMTFYAYYGDAPSSTGGGNDNIGIIIAIIIIIVVAIIAVVGFVWYNKN